MLANYAVDEIYLTETPSWMFEEGDKGREARDVFEKFALNLLKADPTEFVKYNKHQTSRIYPKGTRY